MESWVILIAALFIVGVLLWPTLTDRSSFRRWVRCRRSLTGGYVRSEQLPGTSAERLQFYPRRSRRRK